MPREDRPDVTWQGVNETQVLTDLLGEGALTDDRVGDLLAALARMKEAQCISETRNKIILHALHVELGTWGAVAERTGIPKTTAFNAAKMIWDMAHPDGTPMPRGTE